MTQKYKYFLKYIFAEKFDMGKKLKNMIEKPIDILKLI